MQERFFRIRWVRSGEEMQLPSLTERGGKEVVVISDALPPPVCVCVCQEGCAGKNKRRKKAICNTPTIDPWIERQARNREETCHQRAKSILSK